MRFVNAAVLAAAVVLAAGSAQAQSATPVTKKDVRELKRDHRDLVRDRHDARATCATYAPTDAT